MVSAFKTNMEYRVVTLFRHIRLLAAMGLVIILMMTAINCASPAKPLDTEADFTGFITEIHPVGEKGVIGRILVESHADKLVNKYMVTIKGETLIFRLDVEDYRQVNFKSLKTRQWVQIWSTGPIMESFPMQGTAAQVVITAES